MTREIRQKKLTRLSFCITLSMKDNLYIKNAIHQNKLRVEFLYTNPAYIVILRYIFFELSFIVLSI